MKLATTTAICRTRPDGPRIPLEASARWVKDAGFDEADANFFFAPGEADTPLLREDWKDWAYRTREIFETLGLPFGQAHAPAFSFLFAGEEMDERIALLFRRSYEVCGILGITWTVVHPLHVPNALTFSQIKARNLAYFKRQLEWAGEAGLSIAIENMFDNLHYVGDHGEGGDPRLKRTDAMIRPRRRFGAGLEELLELVDALSAQFPNVGVCWDTGHANESGIPQGEALKLIGSRLKAVHINDNYGIYDDHHAPFHGTIGCWEEIMTALKAAGYEGSLTFETGKFSKHVPTPLLAANLRYQAQIGRYLLSLIKP